jgi:hypothetical protein
LLTEKSTPCRTSTPEKLLRMPCILSISFIRGPLAE